jgi:hypothetical protein
MLRRSKCQQDVSRRRLHSACGSPRVSEQRGGVVRHSPIGCERVGEARPKATEGWPRRSKRWSMVNPSRTWRTARRHHGLASSAGDDRGGSPSGNRRSPAGRAQHACASREFPKALNLRRVMDGQRVLSHEARDRPGRAAARARHGRFSSRRPRKPTTAPGVARSLAASDPSPRAVGLSGRLLIPCSKRRDSLVAHSHRHGRGQMPVMVRRVPVASPSRLPRVR